MKLIMAIIHDEDAFQMMDKLNESNFSVTKLASTGGFLKSGNTTLICGTDEEKIPEFISIIEKTCKSRKQIASFTPAAGGGNEAFATFPVEINVGGATVFVVDVAQFIKV